MISVAVELTADAMSSDADGIAKLLKTDIKDDVGVSATIQVRNPGEVPRSEGKAVRVVDER